MKSCRVTVLLGIIFGTSSILNSLYAAGILLPNDPSLPALSIVFQRVDADIHSGTARVQVVQKFKNESSRDLEATYVFPLPPDAGVEEFAMMINGKRVTAELLEKDKARQIYEDIVRRLKDPGLLEYMDGNLFQAKVFPVPGNGEQQIEISYVHQLNYSHGLYRFLYPLRSPQVAARTGEDFTVKLRLKSDRKLGTIYSPSHPIDVQRTDPYRANIGFEQNKFMLDRDFVLYYGLAEHEVGFGFLSHRKPGEDGYFMLMLTPTVQPDDGKITAKDITFVIDTSGSMAGSKIEQVKGALTYCIQRLNSNDRFRIIRFSTGVDILTDEFLKADDPAREKAFAFIDDLQARGGTDIATALEKALTAEEKVDRPHYIAFLTDGLPTIGVTDIEAILKQTLAHVSDRNRLFAFGVGNDVNTQLLDTLAEKTRGTTVYIHPEENIEHAVSSYYDKIADPILTKTSLKFADIETSEVYPQKLPDLFSGNQLSICGRYSGSGSAKVNLTGEVAGKSKEWTYQVTFPKRDHEKDFIPRLWARRKIGYLLDAMRFNGETAEVKEEIIRLSKEFGIITPYTSFLVVEDEPVQVSPPPRPRPPFPPPHPPYPPYPPPRSLKDGRESGAAVPLFSGGQAEVAESMVTESAVRYSKHEAAPKKVLGMDTGSGAVRMSQEVQRLKQSENEENTYVKHVSGKTFYYLDGSWVDSDYTKEMGVKTLKYGSNEYFAFIREHPELRPYFAISAKLILALNKVEAIVVE